MSKAACVFAVLYVLAIACATGGSSQNDAGPVDSAPHVYHDAHALNGDAPIQPPHDAPPPPPDAFVPQDAPQGGFCSDNTMCGSGTCCWVAVCIPGTPVGTNFCIPQ
jgi:hypothetical protein